MKQVDEHKNIYYNEKNYVPPADQNFDPNPLVIYGPGYYVCIDVYEGDRENVVTDVYGPYATLQEALDAEPKVLTMY